MKKILLGISMLFALENVEVNALTQIGPPNKD